MLRFALTLGVMLWLGQIEASAVDRKLNVTPTTIELNGGSARQQFTVTLTNADGSLRDVTHEARLIVEPSQLARLQHSSVLEPQEDGKGYLRVFFEGLNSEAPIHVRDQTRQSPVSFRLDVSPLLSKAGCNMGACHGNLNGKGGFKLSLRGDNPSYDLAMMTRDTQGRRVNSGNSSQSLIVLKPTGLLPHEGGLRFAPLSIEANFLTGWIERGCRDDLATVPKITAIHVSPTDRVSSSPSLSQQLIVTATLSDGTYRDVTRQAAYDVSDPTKASVSVDGRVTVTGPKKIALQ